MTSNLHPLMAAICEDFLAAPKVLREAQERRLSHDPSQTCSEKDAADARRYRWLRRQQWWESGIACVANPKAAVKLGHDCPSLDRLDAVIDAAMAAEHGTERPPASATARIDLWDQAVCELAKARETGADASTLRRLESAEEMARDAVYEARDIEPKPLFGEDE